MTTPVELYSGIYVKRDDLCFQPPAPPFSKCRGVLDHLRKLKDSGVETVGYTETAISMAGWGVAWACNILDMVAVIFDPQYKVTPDVLAYHREQWKQFHPIIHPIPAGRAKVGWYQSKKILQEFYDPKGVMLPLGLPFEESIEATAKEMRLTLIQTGIRFKSIVSCIGSGTMFAGLWRGIEQAGLSKVNLYGVFTRTGSIEHKKEVIQKKAGLQTEGFLKSIVNIHLIDPGWEYTEECKTEVHFPCHSYYDAKAWEWLVRNLPDLKKPILFWNIGS
jgi:hypothetical protein